MTVLAWERAEADPSVRVGTVLAVHGWGEDAASQWRDSGWMDGLVAAGFSVVACDLPGHAGSADLEVPAGAHPAQWTAELVEADLARLAPGPVYALGAVEGCFVVAHLAVRDPERVPALVLIGVDDHARPRPHAEEVAAALRDPTAPVWSPEAADLVHAARKAPRHDLETLAGWLERTEWPGAARLGALRTPVLVAVGADDERRHGAPRLASLFHDARVVTVAGDETSAVRSPELVQTVTDFLHGWGVT